MGPVEALAVDRKIRFTSASFDYNYKSLAKNGASHIDKPDGGCFRLDPNLVLTIRPADIGISGLDIPIVAQGTAIDDATIRWQGDADVNTMVNFQGNNGTIEHVHTDFRTTITSMGSEWDVALNLVQNPPFDLSMHGSFSGFGVDIWIDKVMIGGMQAGHGVIVENYCAGVKRRGIVGSLTALLLTAGASPMPHAGV
jgi:hypothetical protein